MTSLSLDHLCKGLICRHSQELGVMLQYMHFGGRRSATTISNHTLLLMLTTHPSSPDSPVAGRDVWGRATSRPLSGEMRGLNWTT